MLTTSFGLSSLKFPRSRQKSAPAPQFSGGTHKPDSADELILKSSTKKNPKNKPSGYGTELKRLGLAALLAGTGVSGAAAALNKPKEDKLNPFGGLRGQESFYLPPKLSPKEQREADKIISSFKFRESDEGFQPRKTLRARVNNGRSLLKFNLKNKNGSSDLTNEQAIQILKGPSFPPINKNSFTAPTYGGTAAAPAPARNITEAGVKAELSKVFDKESTGNSADLKKVMKLMDDETLKRIVPDVSLRAALVSLTGTAGEGAINDVLNGKFASVKFAPASAFFNPKGIAEAQLDKTSGQLSIKFNDKYQYEKFQLLSSIFAHEVNHQDPVVGPCEEFTDSAFDTLLGLQILNRDPSIFSGNTTELSQRIATRGSIRINSRDDDGNLSLYKGKGLYPGGLLPDENNFSNEFPGSDCSERTPGNAFWRGAYADITGIKNKTADFDRTTAQGLSDNQKLLTPVEVVKAAKALGLEVPNPA